MRRYNLTGTLNTRDLGGYPAEGGAYTQYGRFLRSDAPCELTRADLDLLHGMGITDVIDLRHPVFEIEKRPLPFGSDARFRCHSLHIDDAMRELRTEADVAPNYFDMLHRNGAVREIMRAIADAEGGVMFSCAAGKDRTGVTAALLLDLAGVAPADIIADYQVTEIYIRPRMAKIFEEFPEIHPFLGRSRPEYIEGFLSRIYDKYNTTEGFLLARGVTPQELERIRRKLILCSTEKS